MKFQLWNIAFKTQNNNYLIFKNTRLFITTTIIKPSLITFIQRARNYETHDTPRLFFTDLVTFSNWNSKSMPSQLHLGDKLHVLPPPIPSIADHSALSLHKTLTMSCFSARISCLSLSYPPLYLQLFSTLYKNQTGQSLTKLPSLIYKTLGTKNLIGTYFLATN